MGNDMSVAEFLGSLAPETQIIAAGLVFLFVLLTGVQLIYLRSLRAREAVQSESEMNAQLARMMRLLEGKGHRDANGRIPISQARAKPVSRSSERRVPAARCPAPRATPRIRRTGR
ncbi:MAG: hypothetical protein C0454_04800 [Parvibaculum sp.]|nr:hypothetical protein [Parvibaculum sp.]